MMKTATDGKISMTIPEILDFVEENLEAGDRRIALNFLQTVLECTASLLSDLKTQVTQAQQHFVDNHIFPEKGDFPVQENCCGQEKLLT